MMNRTLSLFEFNQMVSEAISDSLPGKCWVEAELSEIRESGGHCYMMLVQKDLFGATPVAKAPAKCWRSSWVKVAAKFRNVTGFLPQPGMKVLLLANADFHPAYGFSLIVSDIDPTYTIGDMAQRRKEIIQQLKDEGVFDLQKDLHLPLFTQRIAVISANTAAGYGDFCNQLEFNEYGFRFSVTLFPAVMQGEQVESSIIGALNEIYERINDFDCVVITRGGGAVADMSGFDTLALAENVANFEIPVITAIGHDRDESVLDMVSFQKVKTPTAAAAFLIDRLVSVLDRIDDAESVILSSVQSRIERQKMYLESLVEKVSSHCKLLKQKGEANLMFLEIGIGNSLQQYLLKERHRLDMLEQRVISLDPALLLKRGYSMTTINGHIVKDAKELHKGDIIETRLSEGKIVSQVASPPTPPLTREGSSYMRDSCPDVYSMLKEHAKELRHNSTPAEDVLWSRLRAKQLGVKFRRQHTILDFIADFYCSEKNLIIEVDGGYHNTLEQIPLDEERTRRLESVGNKVLRFTNEQIFNEIDKVIEKIKENL